ncbi:MULTISPECIES: hypothetical protein, partial [Clostridia]|uniref:hypothetical protein n=1 Tax=Clostridia TaxID=186801 RepID=UPI000FF060E1
MFFSLKCGLLVGENLEEKLSDEYQEFVETVIDVKRDKNENGIRNMYEAGMSLYGEFVETVIDVKRDKNENGIRNMYEAGMSLYGD